MCLKLISIMASLMLLACFVLAVELSLRWNSVIGIYNIGSTSQWIPFIIGLLGLLRVIHITIRTTDEDVSTLTEADPTQATDHA